MVKVNKLVLFLILKNFQLFTTEYDGSCRFVVYSLYHVVPSFLRVIINAWILQNPFLNDLLLDLVHRIILDAEFVNNIFALLQIE